MNVFPSVGAVDVEVCPEGISIFQESTHGDDRAEIFIPYMLVSHLIEAIKAEFESTWNSL